MGNAPEDARRREFQAITPVASERRELLQAAWRPPNKVGLPVVTDSILSADSSAAARWRYLA